MATIIADNIITPLAKTSEINYQLIKAGKSALRHYEASQKIPFDFTASLFDEKQNDWINIEGYTRFESLAIQSIQAAIFETPLKLNLLDERTALILSSTKGNVELLSLEDNPNQDNATCLGLAAKRIADYFGLKTDPIVVCNACISGVSALILGNRLVELGVYDKVIVCGIDLQNQFVISGFQSLKALSESECRPFDIERLGLNLGEAAATVILTKNDKIISETIKAHLDAHPDESDYNLDSYDTKAKNKSGKSLWHICNGAVRNDAHHITNPSPSGEGCYCAIDYTLKDFDTNDLAQINVHGTATMYNDQMESKAISRAGLSHIPINALKGYLGHTMGAAGVIETILTMHSLDDGTIIGTRGFEEIGVSGKVNISAESQSTQKSAILKIISGFGGCNGAILLSKDLKDCNCSKIEEDEDLNKHLPSGVETKKEFDFSKYNYTISHRVIITPSLVSIDGISLPVEEKGLKLLTWLYKSLISDYAKFYKMDPLARLGFVATELLLQAEGDKRFKDTNDRAIIFFNSYSSINADREYLKTISDSENFFPSPSLFIYTLPNIVSGEIAIRNKCHAETGFYVLPKKNQQTVDSIIKATFSDTSINSIITGWLEYRDENNFECDLYLVNLAN